SSIAYGSQPAWRYTNGAIRSAHPRLLLLCEILILCSLQITDARGISGPEDHCASHAGALLFTDGLLGRWKPDVLCDREFGPTGSDERHFWHDPGKHYGAPHGNAAATDHGSGEQCDYLLWTRSFPDLRRPDLGCGRLLYRGRSLWAHLRRD